MIRPIVSWLESRKLRTWRIVLTVGIIGLTVATHWPRLRLRAPTPIPIDKLLHVTAFGGLTGLVMLARLLPATKRAFAWRNALFSFLVVAVWSGMDELTQEFPGLGRHATWPDYLANLIGATMALLLAGLVFSRTPASSTP